MIGVQMQLYPLPNNPFTNTVPLFQDDSSIPEHQRWSVGKLCIFVQVKLISK